MGPTLRPMSFAVTQPSSDVKQHIILPEVHWTRKWWKILTLVQIFVPALCMILDAISDEKTPSELVWNTVGRTKRTAQLTFTYRRNHVAYWANAAVVAVGIYGAFVTQSRQFRKSDKLMSFAWKFCIFGSQFCLIDTFVSVWRWQAISKNYLANGDPELVVPFILSVLTCFLQVFPGSAGVFGPLLYLMEKGDIFQPKKRDWKCASRSKSTDLAPLTEGFKPNESKSRPFSHHPEELFGRINVEPSQCSIKSSSLSLTSKDRMKRSTSDSAPSDFIRDILKRQFEQT